MKKILMILVVMLALICLPACNNNSVANAGEEFKLLTLDDLKANSSEENPIVVSFWHSFGHNISKNLDPLIEEFEELYAAQGIYIDIQATSTGGGYDGLRSRVNLGTKSNSIPTMLLGYPDHFANYIDNNILLPLDEFVYAEDANIKIDNVEDFIASYWNECKMTVNGKESVVAIPFNKSTEVTYYNASACDPILHELGYITYDEATKTYGKWLQPTWEQVWAVSEILKTRANSAEGLSWTLDNVAYKSTKCVYPTFIDSAANFFITSTRQWGGEYTRATGDVVFYNDQAIAAQEYFVEKASTEKIWNLPNKLNQSYGSNVLVNNEAFISIGSTAGVNNNDSTKYELKVTAYPQKSYDNNSVQAVIQQGTNAGILSKNSNNITRLAAWLLINYLTSTEVTERFSINTGYLPVRESAKASDTYKAFMADENNPFTGNVAKTVNAAFAQQSYMFTDPAFSGSSAVRDKIDTMVIAIYCNDRAITTAMESSYNDLKRLGINTIKLAQ